MNNTHYICFVDTQQIAQGSLNKVAYAAKLRFDTEQPANLLLFNATDNTPVHLDFSGDIDEFMERLSQYQQTNSRPVGRPKLGVISKEVTLLPRHWDWLTKQANGASATLRRLVEEASKQNQDLENTRQAQEITYRFMHAVAGDLPGFEEATRALFANNVSQFSDLIQNWPSDIKTHICSTFPYQAS